MRHFPFVGRQVEFGLSQVARFKLKHISLRCIVSATKPSEP